MNKTPWDIYHPKTFLRIPRQLTHPIREMMLEYAEGKTVGDFGCGSCIDYPMWVENGYNYTGIDFTEKFINHAKSIYPDIEIVFRNISDTGLPDECFDTTYCKDVLEHQPPEKYLDVLWEMWRLTKHVMMVAFFIAPRDKPTEYQLVSDLFYKNHYNKQEILRALKSLCLVEVIVKENIGYNNSALYIVRKTGC